jgi:FkbM family methyltransferase
MLKRKIARLIKIINIPGALRGLYTLKKKFSISSFRINAVAAEYQPFFYTIIDVGANIGQFALAAAQRFPMAEIYCFEPIPDVYRVLKNNLKNFPKIHVNNCAIGNENGKILFYRNEFTLASSVLPMYEKNIHPNCDAKRSNMIEVDIYRMDDFPSLNIKEPVLLKLDIQGYEKNALEGAKRILQHIDYIAIEMSFVKLYENQPLFDELHEYLKKLGFQLLVPVDINEGDELAILEMDVLYGKVK